MKRGHRRPKIIGTRVAEFIAAWNDLDRTVPSLARDFGVHPDTVYNTVRRLKLPPRMPMLEWHRLPPFGPRKRKAA